MTDASSREVSGNTVVHATFGQFLVATSLDRFLYRPGGSCYASIRVVDYSGSRRRDAGWPIARRARDSTQRPLRRPELRHGQRDDRRDRRRRSRVGRDPRSVSSGRLPRAGVDAGRGPIQSRTTRTSGSPVSGLCVTDEESDWPYEYLELAADKGATFPARRRDCRSAAPTRNGYVLVTKESQDVSWRRVSLSRPPTAIEVPIEEADMGDIFVNVAYLQDDRLFQAEQRHHGAGHAAPVAGRSRSPSRLCRVRGRPGVLHRLGTKTPRAIRYRPNSASASSTRRCTA